MRWAGRREEREWEMSGGGGKREMRGWRRDNELERRGRGGMRVGDGQ